MAPKCEEIEIVAVSDTPHPAFKDFSLRLEITNFSKFAIPATTIVVDRNSYARLSMAQVPSISSGGSVIVSVDVRINRGVFEVTDIPKSFHILYNGQAYSVDIPFFIFTGGLKIFKPPENSCSPNFNILLYGIAGAGKSSFLNSICTLLSPKYNTTAHAASGGSAGHVTRQLTKYPLKDQFGLNINIWDTWGLTPNSYSQHELDYLLEGALPSGWTMADSAFKERHMSYLLDSQVRETKLSRKIHTVIFFISHSSLYDRETVEIIKENYTYLQSHQLVPILILSKTDEVFEEIRTDPSKTDSPRIKDLVHKAAHLLNIPENRINCGINYTKERKKTFEIDRANYQILYKALNSSYQNTIRDYGFSPNVAANPAPDYSHKSSTCNSPGGLNVVPVYYNSPSVDDWVRPYLTNLAKLSPVPLEFQLIHRLPSRTDPKGIFLFHVVTSRVDTLLQEDRFQRFLESYSRHLVVYLRRGLASSFFDRLSRLNSKFFVKHLQIVFNTFCRISYS